MSRAIKDPDPQARFSAALSLAQIGPTAEAAVPALKDALHDENRYVPGYAVEALERIATPAAIRVLLPFLKTAAGVRTPRPPASTDNNTGGKLMSRTSGVLRACLAALLVALTGHVARAEQVRLTWFMWSGTEPEVVAWKHVAELVTQKYPDITVEFQTTSFPDYWTKLPALAAAGKLPDIVSLQSLRAPGFAELMVPLDDRIKADKFDIDAFDPSISKACRATANSSRCRMISARWCSTTTTTCS